MSSVYNLQFVVYVHILVVGVVLVFANYMAYGIIYVYLFLSKYLYKALPYVSKRL